MYRGQWWGFTLYRMFRKSKGIWGKRVVFNTRNPPLRKNKLDDWVWSYTILYDNENILIIFTYFYVKFSVEDLDVSELSFRLGRPNRAVVDDLLAKTSFTRIRGKTGTVHSPKDGTDVKVD